MIRSASLTRYRLAVVCLLACGGPPAPAPVASATGTRDAGGEAPLVADAGPARFVRQAPPIDARRSVDACAYQGTTSMACIDALTREPDPVRVRYMRRLADARVKLSTIALDPEIAECCNATGPCGADKRAGHADCPKMDDGHACLVAAELLRAKKKDASVAHARACRCDWSRAQIAVPGGSLACDGPDRLVERRASPDEREITACAACDPATGLSACTNEIARLRTSDPELARWLEQVHVVRCQVP